MNTIEGGIKYPIIYLDWIISLYGKNYQSIENQKEEHNRINFKTENVDSMWDSTSLFIVADYVSEIYSSRKTAFINMLNDINGSSLPLDGDIGKLTVEEIKKVIKLHVKDRNKRKILIKSIDQFSKISRRWTKEVANIEKFEIYKMIHQKWQKKFHRNHPNNICPNITYYNMSTLLKLHGEISVRDYVVATERFYKKYFNQLLAYDHDHDTESNIPIYTLSANAFFVNRL